MLTDPELDEIASAHANTFIPRRSGLHTVVAERRFALDDPAGVYFTIGTAPDDGFVVGTWGFFVYRETGIVRDIGSGELFDRPPILRDAVDPRFFDLSSMLPTPAGLQRLLLKDQLVRPTTSGVAEPQPHPSRRWWQFWQ